MPSSYFAIPLAPGTLRGMSQSQTQDVGGRAGIDHEMVQLGVRIPRPLHFALKAAALRQERDGKSPHTQAEIVAEAIGDWLHTRGFDA